MKKLIFVTLCLALMLTLCSCATFIGGATYELSEDGSYAEVVGLNPSRKWASIATKYEGVPVTAIRTRAFENCYNLVSVSIPTSITEIGDEAFLDCSSLEKVNFAEGSELTTIGASAFKNCKKLGNVEIPESVTEIGASAFEGCESFTEIKIPDSVTDVGKWAFSGCFRTRSVEVGKSLKRIDRSVFSGCTRVESLSISLESDLNGAIATFFGESLKTLTVTGGTEIPDGAFANSTITSINLPNSITTIGTSAFANCTSLASVVIPETVTYINEYAFSNCTSLTSIDIPSGVKTIGASAFAYCTSLVGVVIPETVTYIKEYAFSNCTSLASVDISSGVKTIGTSAFAYCTSLTSIEAAEENRYFKTIDGSLYTKDGKTLLLYAAGKKDSSFTVPEGVETISAGAFSGCDNLMEIVIPKSVTSIETRAFRYCSRLNKVYYGGTVEEWGNISIGTYNSNLTSTTRYYYSETKPTTNGRFWYYDASGNITVW